MTLWSSDHLVSLCGLVTLGRPLELPCGTAVCKGGNKRDDITKSGWPNADDEPDVVLLGVGGGDEEDPVEPPEDDKRGDVSTLISEFLVLAFPLLYTPGGTGRFLRLGSSSMVGKFCKSAYVK